MLSRQAYVNLSLGNAEDVPLEFNTGTLISTPSDTINDKMVIVGGVLFIECQGSILGLFNSCGGSIYCLSVKDTMAYIVPIMIG